MRLLTSIVAISVAATPAFANDVVVRCKFEKLPPMVLIYRDRENPRGNTLKIGAEPPVPLSVGSSLSTAEYGAQEMTFSLRLPASVTISAPGNDTKTYGGVCKSSLPR